MKIIKECIDWTSVKLNLISVIGFVSQDEIIFGLSVVATGSTIIYNGLNIYKYFNKKKKS